MRSRPRAQCMQTVDGRRLGREAGGRIRPHVCGCVFGLRCDASGRSQKDKRRDSSSTSSPPPPLHPYTHTHTHTHRAKCLLASASLVHPLHDVHGLKNSDVFSSPSLCNYRQTDRQTDRQWGGSDRTELYLYIPVVILLPHREMTHFHCSVCASVS